MIGENEGWAGKGEGKGKGKASRKGIDRPMEIAIERI
jgi:hypothetical protein